MNGVSLAQVQSAIRDIPDFPKPGIIFKDITPVLADAALFGWVIDSLAAKAGQAHPDKIVGIDARGFLFGAAVAYKLRCGFVPIRKKGKLPHRCVSYAYELEYGSAQMEMHVDGVRPGERVVLVDDLLATGGTSGAALHLVRETGGNVQAALFFIELAFLKGRERLLGVPVQALIRY
ncbi:MAG TPA: adenine phosphoribosyltransferase [Chthoniobacterales bacterium]